MSDESIVILRDFNPEEDAPFIYSSWRNALWFSEPRADRLSDEFYTFATKEIRQKLNDPENQVRIACLSDIPSLIIGYSVMNGKHLDWVYVKIDYRKKGIGKLLTQGFETVSYPITKVVQSIAYSKGLKIREEKK